jgi:hypothetical protein
MMIYIYPFTCKNKVVLLIPWRHLGGGERRYSFYFFLTSALEEGEWSASCPRGNEPTTHCTGGWVTPEAVWMQRLEEKSSASVRDGTPVIQFIVRQYTDGAAWLTHLYVDFVIYFNSALYTHSYSMFDN